MTGHSLDYYHFLYMVCYLKMEHVFMGKKRLCAIFFHGLFLYCNLKPLLDDFRDVAGWYLWNKAQALVYVVFSVRVLLILM